MSMELDEMKQAWQALDRHIERQQTLNLLLLRESRLDRLRHGLRPLVWGQAVQIAFGVATMLWGISFWTTHMGVMHQMACGILVQVFGVLMIAFAGYLLFQLQAIDYATPVLGIQGRLARLRAWRVRVEAPIFAVLGSIVWVPVVLMLIQYDFDQWGGDYWTHAPELAGYLVFSGFVSLMLVVLVYWLVRRAGHRRWLENNFAGSAVRKAESTLDEIARFERE
ncbi:hypothetical protein B5P43_12690 [Bacillus sp. SRB_336]|nr:hypothetical protein B5P43_12690 [Bacillus sp. SRB_336]